MTRAIYPFLMFEGRAEEAMTFYTSLIPGSRIEEINRYGPDGPGREGTVMTARFSVAGQAVMCIASIVSHAFTFTPSFSFFIECDDAPELDRLFAGLSRDGKVFMPLDNYGFSQRFGWCSDRFGVSWQLNLASGK